MHYIYINGGFCKKDVSWLVDLIVVESNLLSLVLIYGKKNKNISMSDSDRNEDSDPSSTLTPPRKKFKKGGWARKKEGKCYN